jgi:hypothetical protein
LNLRFDTKGGLVVLFSYVASLHSFEHFIVLNYHHMTSVSSISMATVGKAAIATIAGLAAYYNDRAIFDENRDMPTYPGQPLVGNLPMLIKYKDKIHDLFLETYHKHNTLTM